LFIKIGKEEVFLTPKENQEAVVTVERSELENIMKRFDVRNLQFGDLLEERPIIEDPAL